MAKYAGLVGYVTQVESSPGIWKDQIIEKKLRGDVLSQAQNFQIGDKIVDDVTITNRISLIIDPYAKENSMNMRYLHYLGLKWKITSISIVRPRLIVTLGDEWNE